MYVELKDFRAEYFFDKKITGLCSKFESKIFENCIIITIVGGYIWNIGLPKLLSSGFQKK
jgi:hypothetical protein